MSAPSSRRSRRLSRRKAGKAAPKRKSRKLVFRLVVEAQEMIVHYTPDHLTGEFPFGLFEFRSPHKPSRRILVSETGYRSHCALMTDIAAMASPKEYAHELVLDLLRQSREGSRRKETAEQLSLF